MAKTKKIDKEFCFTDDSVNCYGYRMLTSGLALSEIAKNPIGFKMHNRDKGVVLRWEDFRIDGDRAFAKPVINLAHPDGQQIVDEVENGFLNGASCGKIVVIEASDDSALMLPGQSRPTVTKWFPREISLVDIPGNYNALGNLFDEDGNELNLADFVITKNQDDMSKPILAAFALTALNLSDNASQAEVDKAFEDLLAQAKEGAKVPKLTKDLADKTKEYEDLKLKYDELEKTDVAKKVADLIAKGKSDKKLTVKLADTLAAQYADNPEGLEALLADMPAQASVIHEETDENLGDFAGKTYDDLYATGKLEDLKAKHPAYFEKIKKDKFKTT